MSLNPIKIDDFKEPEKLISIREYFKEEGSKYRMNDFKELNDIKITYKYRNVVKEPIVNSLYAFRERVVTNMFQNLNYE